MNRSTVIILLILAGQVSVSVSMTMLGLVTKIILGYVLYSIGMEKYITRKFNSILQLSKDAVLPLSSSGEEQSSVGQSIGRGGFTNEESSPSTIPSVSDLRKTISRHSHIVENPKNRERWNTWALSPPGDDASSMDWTPAGKQYKFAYRSYVDAEEKMAMLAPRLTFHRFCRSNFLSRKVGTMVIDNDGQQVSISDYFWLQLIKPVTITWYGRIETVGGRKQIVWTSTEMKLPEETIINPSVSERLRQIPWDIVKEEDGMLLLQRGDVGVLAYDRVE